MLQPIMGSVSPDQVRAEVEKFWQIMCGKSAGRLEDLYSSAALLLTGKARKPEPASMALARRARQINEAGADSTAELGPIEVQIAEAGVAIASYTYRFNHKRPDERGGSQMRRTLWGRATQIFQIDERGALHIVHEHLSAATNPEVEKSRA
jgi:ketosteroid isomerase-like protein